MLTLKPIGLGQPNDYEVLNSDCRAIGRIMWAQTVPADHRWFLTIVVRVPQQATDRGYAVTLKKAKRVFKLAWEPMVL
jgi:hypothetical protein